MTTQKRSTFVELLKKHTDIDEDFINTFFSKFRIGGDLDFDVKDTNVAKYLGIKLITLRQRLANEYSKNINFMEKVDYIKIKTGKTSGVMYMLNYQCFEKLAMSGDSYKSELVRMYFVKIRRFLFENQKLIYQAMENKMELNKFNAYEIIYFFAVDEANEDIFKIGRTLDIIKRLRNYNVGRIKEVDLKYYSVVKNSILIEKCMKTKLKSHQVKKRAEIYQVEPKTIKKIIDECYNNYVSKKENDELYKELSDLLGLYAYTTDKKTIKPYVIIGTDL
jgi:hypothetical protein